MWPHLGPKILLLIPLQDENGIPAFNLKDNLMESPINPLTLITERQLNEMAEFSEIPKTEHWHSGLAWAMLVAKYYAPAMKHFQAALHINPNMWIAMYGLGKCLGGQHCFKEAIFWMDKALQSLLPGQGSCTGQILQYVAEYKEKLGDSDGALAASEERLHKDPFDIPSVTDHLKILHRMQQHEAILKLIRDVDQHETSFEDYACSTLVKLLSYGYDIGDPVGEAITIVGGTTGSEVLEIMRKAFEEAIVVADQKHPTPAASTRIRIRIHHCEFYSHHLNEIDKSIIYWESALQFITEQPDQHHDFDYARIQCKIRLSETFFHKAVEARRNGVDTEPWSSKLQRVSSQLMPTDDPNIAGGNDYASHLYGIWLRKYAAAEEHVWRAFFRESLLEGIKLLSDDDPSNGYTSLARTLLHAGDVDSGLATLSLALKPLELLQAKVHRKAQAQNCDISITGSSATPEDDPPSPCELFISNPENTGPFIVISKCIGPKSSGKGFRFCRQMQRVVTFHISSEGRVFQVSRHTLGLRWSLLNTT
jgi:tetratricopeptide (TPR) repeat protein